MTLSVTTSYGSKSYQHEILKDRPVAYFTSYNSSSSKLIDSSNRDMLSASLAAGASYTKRIPPATVTVHVVAMQMTSGAGSG